MKTITKEELESIIELAPKMVNHFSSLTKQGKRSVLARVYGVFRFKLEGSPDIYLILMPNAIKRKLLKSRIDYRFDLKGSSINRQVLPNANQMNLKLLKFYQKKYVLKD